MLVECLCFHLLLETKSKSSIDNDMVSNKINECVVLELS